MWNGTRMSQDSWSTSGCAFNNLMRIWREVMRTRAFSWCHFIVYSLSCWFDSLWGTMLRIEFSKLAEKILHLRLNSTSISSKGTSLEALKICSRRLNGLWSVPPSRWASSRRFRQRSGSIKVSVFQRSRISSTQPTARSTSAWSVYSKHVSAPARLKADVSTS